MPHDNAGVGAIHIFAHIYSTKITGILFTSLYKCILGSASQFVLIANNWSEQNSQSELVKSAMDSFYLSGVIPLLTLAS